MQIHILHEENTLYIVFLLYTLHYMYMCAYKYYMHCII